MIVFGAGLGGIALLTACLAAVSSGSGSKGRNSLRVQAANVPPPPLADAEASSDREDAMKRCPDCAENVKAAARVCRFCGYRFDGG
jgi:hypothetical protein